MNSLARFWRNLKHLLTPFSLKVYRSRVSAKLPRRSTDLAAGYDLTTPKWVKVDPGQIVLIPLGFSAWFPAGWEASFYARSGHGIKGVIKLAGLIDCDYQNEWVLALYNAGPTTQTYDVGDRVGQVVFRRCAFEPAEEVNTLPAHNSNRTGGFGSTGK